MTELKPCPNPRCRTIKPHCFIIKNARPQQAAFWKACCTNCHMLGPEAISAETAAQRWNALPRPEPGPKPCPKCNATLGLHLVSFIPWEKQDCIRWYAACRDCGTQGPNRDTMQLAQEGWNDMPREAKPEPVEPEHKCPHCGSRVRWVKGVSLGCRRCRLECRRPECGACSPSRPTGTEAYAAWWEPFEATEAVGDCPWCRQECEIVEGSIGGLEFFWSCPNPSCFMKGPTVKSRGLAKRTLVRFNRKMYG